MISVENENRSEFDLSMSPPSVELSRAVEKMLGDDFTSDEKALVSSAIAAIFAQPMHPDVNPEAFIGMVDGLIRLYRANLPLALSVLQSLWVNGLGD